jgi:hypothetical protein
VISRVQIVQAPGVVRDHPGVSAKKLNMFKAVRSDCKQFFFRPEKTELDYDTGIFMRLWNVKNVVSANSVII